MIVQSALIDTGNVANS